MLLIALRQRYKSKPCAEDKWNLSLFHNILFRIFLLSWMTKTVKNILGISLRTSKNWPILTSHLELSVFIRKVSVKLTMVVHSCDPGTKVGKARGSGWGVQGHAQLHCLFEISLDHLRWCFKNKTNKTKSLVLKCFIFSCHYLSV